MTTAAQLLPMFGRGGKRREAWRRLLQADTLFNVLGELVRNRDAAGLKNLENGVIAAYEGHDDVAWRCRHDEQYELIRKCVGIAKIAIENPPPTDHELDVVIREITQAKPRDDLTWSCLRLWRSPSSPVVKIPLAVVSDQRARILSLELRVLEGGKPDMAFPHPCDEILGGPHHDFAQSMADAFAAARTSTLSGDYEGYWRVIETIEGRETPCTALQGQSAGGAAVLGWYHALTRTQPDPGIIVLAGLDKSAGGEQTAIPLCKVDDDTVAAKARAIGEEEQFDTIVVASESNREKAVVGLEAAGYRLLAPSDTPQFIANSAGQILMSRDSGRGQRWLRILNLERR